MVLLTYYDPVTGLTFESQAFMNTIAGQQTIAAFWAAHPTTNPDTGGTSAQTGSQYWENSSYNGPDPSLAVKAAYSDAQYAYDYAVAAMNNAANKIAASPASATNTMSTAAASYTTATTQTQTAADALTNLTNQLSGYGNTALTWIESNLIWVVVGVVALFVLPSLLGAATGRRYGG